MSIRDDRAVFSKLKNMKMPLFTISQKGLALLITVCPVMLPSVLAAESPDIIWSNHAHTNIVSSVAFSADGSLLASGSSDETIRIWQAGDGTLVRVLTNQYGLSPRVAFTPDGTLASWDY